MVCLLSPGLLRTVEDAVDLACRLCLRRLRARDGDAADGYEMLLAGCDRAKEAEANGEAWGRSW
jgi:hypothetical protein